MIRHKLTLALIYKLHQCAMTTKEISNHFGISLRLAQMMIRDLREDQILVKIGTRYALDHESGFIWLFKDLEEQTAKPCEGCPGL
jgi:predicted transcriptional regulator